MFERLQEFRKATNRKDSAGLKQAARHLLLATTLSSSSSLTFCLHKQTQEALHDLRRNCGNYILLRWVNAFAAIRCGLKVNECASRRNLVRENSFL
jgi:hypothetical protein